VWNEAGSTLEFSIAPAYYQTRWFQALVVASGLAALWTAYLFRIRQVARAYQRRLDERVNERTRIARELHDTLLQSFQALALRFQTALNVLPDRPAEAKARLAAALERADEAIAEGRNAVQGLRDSTTEKNDLAAAIRTFGDALANESPATTGVAFSVAVEGESRDLHPIIRDEIYNVAAEALRNAFRHARARSIGVEIRYERQYFRLLVTDDGKGIERALLTAGGTEGHYGLRGMSERAGLIGGKLAVSSELGAGTEVELRLPARIAYATSRRRSWLARPLASKTPAQSEEDAP
jgi:signal transduction histidine kinase